MNYLLFNPLSKNGTGCKIKDEAKLKLNKQFPQLKEINVLDLNVEDFITNLQVEDILILVGGDGTLNHFANFIYKYKIKNTSYLYKAGTGNDFIRDIKSNDDDTLFYLNPYLEKLPTVTVNGIKRKFINGIGYGIDGMVCETAEELRLKNKKKINYTGLSIKLLLTKYSTPKATIIVDGMKKNYDKVWLSSSMNGRYYGGGMKVAPTQNRLNNNLTLVVMHNSRKLKTLMVFPKIFKGEHLKYNKMCEAITGKKIEVHFSKPMALQIDGEVIKNVTSYIAEIE